MTNVDFGRYKRIVQFFWDPEPKNDDADAAIWCLGQQYSTPPSLPKSSQPSPSIPPRHDGDFTPRPADSLSSVDVITPNTSLSSSPDDGLAYGEAKDAAAAAAGDGGWPAAFLDDFESRIWLTYRSNFPPITKSRDPAAQAAMKVSVRLRSQLLDQGGFTSDSGWGCMIRSGQSLLANALVMLRLGRDWRRGSRRDEESRLVSLFADDPRAPFSIHRFVEHGATACGKHPGEWFGPSATARCIQALCNQRPDMGLRVYVTSDGSDVYEDSFMKVAQPVGEAFQPTLVLVGIRLGIDRVTPVYWEALKASLQMPQSIGIAGGRPSSSHYFTGVQRSHFFYLDPHHTRPALPLHDDPGHCTADELDSVHTRRLRRLHLAEMDPSMLIAFLIRDEADWRSWRKAVGCVGEGGGGGGGGGGKPVVNVADVEPSLGSSGTVEREGAVDEVEILDDDDDGESLLGDGGGGGDGGDEDDVVTISASEL